MPVDGGEVASRPQGRVQGPEYLHDTEGSLGHRLREVSAARGDSTDDADGALEAAEGLRPSRPFVEFAQPRGQVGREAFLARHLLQSTRDLSHRLRPA